MPGSGNSMCKGPVPGQSKAPSNTDGVWRGGKVVRLEARKVRLKQWFSNMSAHQHHLECGAY